MPYYVDSLTLHAGGGVDVVPKQTNASVMSEVVRSMNRQIHQDFFGGFTECIILRLENRPYDFIIDKYTNLALCTPPFIDLMDAAAQITAAINTAVPAAPAPPTPVYNTAQVIDLIGVGTASRAGGTFHSVTVTVQSGEVLVTWGGTPVTLYAGTSQTWTATELLGNTITVTSSNVDTNCLIATTSV